MTTSATSTSRCVPSRTTRAIGLTSAESFSSAFLARISWNEPITTLATTTPRNSASASSPRAIVTAPRAIRMLFGRVKRLPRTIVQYDRLVAGFGGLPRSARSRRASSSLRPRCDSAGAVSVTTSTAILQSARGAGGPSQPCRGARDAVWPARAGRQRDLSRLGWRGLHLPLARADDTRPPRVARFTSTTASAVSSRRRMPGSVSRGSAQRWSRHPEPVCRRPSSATFGTQSLQGPSGQRVTPLRTRSRRFSTAWSRAGRRAGSGFAARTASCARCSASGGTRPTAYCRGEGLPFRIDSSNPKTKRGLIRNEILPLLRRLHPAVDENLLAALEEPRTLPKPVERAIADLLASADGSKRLDLGGGKTAVREYTSVWVERSPARLTRPVRWGRWLLEPRVSGLVVRSWRAGDRLAGRGVKVQDLFVHAKIPRSERDSWPLVVKGDSVVLVPGVASAPGYEEAVMATEDGDDEGE